MGATTARDEVRALLFAGLPERYFAFPQMRLSPRPSPTPPAGRVKITNKLYAFNTGFDSTRPQTGLFFEATRFLQKLRVFEQNNPPPQVCFTIYVDPP